MSAFAWLYYVANVALVLYSLSQGCPHPLPWVALGASLLGAALYKADYDAASEAMPQPLRSVLGLSSLGFLCLYVYAWAQGWPAPLPQVLLVWQIVSVGLFLAGQLR